MQPCKFCWILCGVACLLFCGSYALWFKPAPQRIKVPPRLVLLDNYESCKFAISEPIGLAVFDSVTGSWIVIPLANGSECTRLPAQLDTDMLVAVPYATFDKAFRGRSIVVSGVEFTAEIQLHKEFKDVADIKWNIELRDRSLVGHAADVQIP